MTVTTSTYKSLVESFHLDTMTTLAIQTHNQKEPQFLQSAIELLDQFPLTQQQNTKIVEILRKVPSNNNPAEAASLMKKQVIQVLSEEVTTQNQNSTHLFSSCLTPKLDPADNQTLWTQEVPEKMNYSFLGLPIELAYDILLRLDLRDISTFSLVSRQWNQVTSQDSLWQVIYNRNVLPRNPLMDCSQGFKNAYNNYKMFNLNLRKPGAYTTTTFSKHEHWITSLTAANGKLFSGSNDSTIKIWDIKTTECLATLEAHQGPVTCLIIADGNLFSSSIDTTIKMWNLETQKRLKVFEGHSHPVDAIVVDGNKLISGSMNGQIKIWDIETGICLNTLKDKSCITSLIVADGKLYSSSLKGAIGVWDLKMGLRLRKLNVGAYYPVTSLTSADGRLYSAAALKKKIHCWDLETGNLLETIKCEHGPVILRVVDRKLFVARFPIVGELDGPKEAWIMVRDLDTGEWLNNTFSKQNPRTGVGLAIADGKLFSATLDDTICSFNFTFTEELIFEKIAETFTMGAKGASIAMERFCLMPDQAKSRVYEALYHILKPFPNDYWGCAEDAFLNQHGLSSTPEQKAQAIEKYLQSKK
jgi:F-box/WD-40 domain protein 7